MTRTIGERLFCDFPTCSSLATRRLTRSDGLAAHHCPDHRDEVMASLRQWPSEPILSVPVPEDCLLRHNAHTEQWARNAITRRGGDWTMRWCDQCGAWHLWNPTTGELG